MGREKSSTPLKRLLNLFFRPDPVRKLYSVAGMMVATQWQSE